MATALDIVTRAFRKVRVGGVGETLEAEYAAEGIDALNDMLHEWKLRGVDLMHADIELPDTFTLPPEYHSGVVYMLAERLRPDFARPREFDADDFFRAIQAAYMVIDEVEFSRGLTSLPSGIKRHYEN